MSQFVTRFAPSPTGLLHLGHGASALCAFDWAQKNDARFLLRIEDIDTGRCQAAFETALMEDLCWLGIAWEMPVRRQAEHMDEYAKVITRLSAMGVIYRCFLTRREVMNDTLRAPHDDGLIYHGPKHVLSVAQEQEWLEQGKAFAWRISLIRAREVLGAKWYALHWHETGMGPDGKHGEIRAMPQQVGDVIVARKDIATSYHVAVTHDDARQGITHILRGKDLWQSTHIHVLLQALLGWPTPIYHHHGLLLDETGKRLAKRDGAASLQSLRNMGKTPAQVRQMARFA